MERKEKVMDPKRRRPQQPITDERFTHALNDPIYRRIPKKEKRVDIDKRFQSMFHDKQFKTKYSVDKRGRPIDLSTNEDLRQYYNLVEDEEGGDLVKEEEISETDEKPQVPGDASSASSESDDDDVEGNVSESDIKKSDPSATLSKTMKKKLRDANFDYARGDGLLVEEESSDDSSSTGDEEEIDTTHAWGELDHDAERTEESTTRLALCNMDWDRLKAVDLMVLFHSFLPPGGMLKTVNIYTSEYGKQRLAEEEVHGPLELRTIKEESEDEDSDDDVKVQNGGDDEDDEGDGYHMEKLRQYQLNRLKYFYAVLEFDSVESTEKIYSECDGMEYESSATRVDFRYIPEDMVFDDEPTDSCDALPQAEKYRPRFFTTTALQQAKVTLTWDETDPLRRELTQKVHNPKEKVDDEDLRAYLASDSDDEVNDGDDGEGSDTASNVDPVAKYRALLEGIETQEKKKEKDVEMEITWGVGLKEKTEFLVKKKLEEKKSASLTPWEEILEKKKDKRKLKKSEKKKGQDHGDEDKESDRDAEDQMFSDDDVDVDMNDPFFKEEIASNDILKTASRKKKVKSEKQMKKPSDVDNAELELLLMDDTDNKQHFSLKKIMKAENESKGKKKKNRKGKKPKEDSKVSEDSFQVDVGDSRFGALFSSHLYNVDPSDPNFKKTKGMDTIIQEKQKRRMDQEQAEVQKCSRDDEPPAPKASKKSELSYLVKSVKRNAQLLKNKVNRRK